jgi:FlaG/FlaF family flagellin (archaellin)
MVNKMTAVILLIAITVFLVAIVGGPTLKAALRLPDDTSPETNVKVGYTVDGNRLTIIQITGNNNIPLPPGLITINSADNQATLSPNIAWKKNGANTIEAGTTIINNVNKEINLKMFYINKPVIDAVLQAGSNSLINMNPDLNGTCDGCVATNSTITFQ